MQLQLTPKRILLGVGLSLLLLLPCIGDVLSGKWSMTKGTVFGIFALVLAWTAAFTARLGPQAERRADFRRFLLTFLLAIAFFLVLFDFLDALHVPWRQYWR